MGFVSDTCKESIRSRVPLEELLREYNVSLIGSGKRLRALCPFHAERTPSFFVDVERQTYHCFGCGEHGDVFRFVEKVHQVDFLQALEILARRAGVPLETLPEGARRLGGRSVVALYDALELAAEFYRRALLERPEAAGAREYLLRRGIERASWERFRLGFSLAEWDGLLRFASARGVGPQVLERAGLARARERGAGHYDYFRGRLMFPVADPQGRIVGFGARTLGSEEPKYLNTPRTPVFDKSQVLYGLDRARAAIQRAGKVCIVEGYTDAIVAHQSGLEFFVATLGTALSRENALRLSRLAPAVVVVFDGDAAGQKASERTLDLLVGESLDVRVYTVTEGKDPCDAILGLGGEEFWRRVEGGAVGIFEFKWRRTMESPAAKEAGPATRARALDEFLRLVVKIPNVVARKLVIRQFSERVGVPEADIEARLKQLFPRGAGAGSARRGAGGDPSEWRRGRADIKKTLFGPGGPVGAPERAGAASARGSEGPAPVAGHDAARQGELEELILECCLARPERAKEILAKVPAGFFEDPVRAAVLRAVERQAAGGVLTGERVREELEGTEAAERVREIQGRIQLRERDEAKGYYEDVSAGLEKDIRRHLVWKRLEGFRRAIAREEGAPGGAVGDPERLRSLRREYFEALKEWKKGQSDGRIAGSERSAMDAPARYGPGRGGIRGSATSRPPVEGEGSTASNETGGKAQADHR